LWFFASAIVTKPSSEILPLVVDMDGTLLKVDTLFEMFAAELFSHPLRAIAALSSLRRGIAAFKARLADKAPLDVEALPANEELLDYIQQARDAGRPVHLVTAADLRIADRVAERFGLFTSVHGTRDGVNLKGPQKAAKLQQMFPEGYVYAGDSSADMPVWRAAKAAIVVSGDHALHAAVQSAGIPVEHAICDRGRRRAIWIKSLRPHQWAKNLVVLVPVVLGWHDTTSTGVVQALVVTGLLCWAASLTYLVNDMADLASDRKHWSKRRRGFASGAISVRDGLLLVGILLPLVCAITLVLVPAAGVCLLLYVAVTLGYSFGWKRIPLFDTFIIALLFTIRILIGIAAAGLLPSAWLLTFSMFFFFSLALAKRHTEILRAEEHSLKKLAGRGYQAGDQSLTLAFGTASAMGSILIVVLYLVEEVFARQLYSEPAWLWCAPIAIFLFVSRIWMLSHRGRMTDDPVAFALRDKASLGLGLFVAIAILLAL
jgi:4-hydroxybenzoate polyprenyltransferase/phosphoserine phosphatase